MNPHTKNMMVPTDIFIIIKPAVGDRVQQDRLVVTATPPKVGATNITELELRYLDAPPTQRNSYPYVTAISVDTEKLRQGYPVAQIVTGGYSGRWQVRARASMKAVPGRWSFPVQFHLIKPPPSPPMAQVPLPSSSVMQAPSPSPMQRAPLPSSSVMQAPSPSVGIAPTMVRPPTTSSQGGATSSLFVRPRGLDDKGGKEGNETVDTTAEPKKKP
jgi:hypothetical protein